MSFTSPLFVLAEGIDLELILLVVGLLVVFVLLLIFLKFFKLWIQAYFSGAKISLFELIGMWLRKVNANVIVHGKIAMVQALSLIHISEPTRRRDSSRMPSSA